MTQERETTIGRKEMLEEIAKDIEASVLFGKLQSAAVKADAEDAIQPERSGNMTSAEIREAILEEAKCCVCGHRAEDYGKPEDSFGVIARLWTAYTGYEFEARDVAAMMILLKIARIEGGSKSIDNWTDIAGYAACGGEILSRGINTGGAEDGVV